MDVWNQRIIIALVLVLCIGSVLADEAQPPRSISERVVLAQGGLTPDNLEPLLRTDRDRRTITSDKLDTENFEFGVRAGLINIEDFGSSAVTSVRLAYHVTEDFFLEADYGRTRLNETSFERLSGGAQLLTDEQRDTTYYHASVGYKVFPGEIFIGDRYSFYTTGYVSLGAGSFTFADEQHAAYAIGAGFAVFPTDWLSVQLNLRDIIFEHDLLGEPLTTQNLEASIGLTAYF